GPRDAVFNVHETLLANPPPSRRVALMLLSKPSVVTFGTVREISPTVDAASGTVKVRVGLEETPPEMTLGASVVGSAKFSPVSAVIIPWSALFKWQGRPAVWIVDAPNDTVAIKQVSVL